MVSDYFWTTFAADVAREGAWKFGSQKARQGAWKFGSKMAREPGRFGAQIASKRAPNVACNLGGGFAADVAREGAWKFGSQMARRGAWEFGSKMVREPGRFGAQIASKRAPNIACNLGGTVAGVVAFSLTAPVGREIAGNIGI